MQLSAYSFSHIIEVISIGLILSADSFSAAIAMGHRPFTRKDAFLFALSSGSAEALVSLVGAMAGTHIVSRFEAYDHWVAFLLLLGVAVHMGYEGISEYISKEEKIEKLDFHSFTKVIIVSFATSLDAFGVGIGLGISDKPLIPFVISIGFWAFITTLLGLNLARRLSTKFGPVMSIVGAIILTMMAFQMLKI